MLKVILSRSECSIFKDWSCSLRRDHSSVNYTVLKRGLLPSQICSHSILSLTGSSWNSSQLKILKL